MVKNDKKNENRKIMIIGIVATLSVTALFGWAFSLLFYNPFLHKKINDYYSNDSNFYKFRACINEVEEIGYIYIDYPQSLDERYSSDIPFKDNNFMRMFSTNIETTWEKFNPTVGMEIEFYGSFAQFYNSQPYFIIEITIGGNEILSFEDGKTALLQWASTYY